MKKIRWKDQKLSVKIRLILVFLILFTGLSLWFRESTLRQRELRQSEQISEIEVLLEANLEFEPLEVELD